MTSQGAGHPEDEPKEKWRSGTVAGLFNLLVPGLGFMYLGKPKLAIAVPVTFWVLLAVAGWTGIIFVSHVYLALFGLILVLLFSSILCAAWMAEFRPPAVLNPSQRWYFYCLFALVTVGISSWIVHDRPRLLGYETFKVAGANLMPTLVPGDVLITDPTAYNNAGPQRGDLITFVSPMAADVILLQRVVGLPGDHVQVVSGRLKINGVDQNEPYANFAGQSSPSELPVSITIRDSHYFVLGDQRNQSLDSRIYGPIPADSITGNVRSIVYSYNGFDGVQWNRFGLRLDAPATP